MPPGTTDALYLDVELPAGAEFSQEAEPSYNAFVYPYEGSMLICERDAAKPLEGRSAGLLSASGRILVSGSAEGARFLLLAGRPLKEPVVRYGPFVMNTREEIEQAIRDYQNGELAAVR